GAGADARQVSRRRRLWLGALRLRLAAAMRDADDRPGRARRGGLPRSRRARDRAAQQAQGVRAAGRRTPHRRGQREAGHHARPAELRDRRPDPPRSGPLHDPGTDQQSDEVGGAGRLRARDRRARAHRPAALGREPLLPRRQAGQARSLPDSLTVATVRGRVAVVVSRYNEVVTARLLEGARRCLKDKGVPEARVDVIWVPGAFELPVAAEAAAAAARATAAVLARLSGAAPRD